MPGRMGPSPMEIEKQERERMKAATRSTCEFQSAEHEIYLMRSDEKIWRQKRNAGGDHPDFAMKCAEKGISVPR